MSADSLRLTTERLLLRLVKEEDAEPTAALVTPDVSANLSTWPSRMSPAQVLDKIRDSQSMLAAGEGMDWAIVDLASDRLMGWIGLKRMGENRARLGYWIDRSFRNRGFIKEAIAAVVPTGSDFLDVRTVFALVFKDNLPSIGVLKASGFVLTGEDVYYRAVVDRAEPCLRFEWHRPKNV
jgi:ribosomal-protein-alanine N-acetyltransferase